VLIPLTTLEKWDETHIFEEVSGACPLEKEEVQE
jgi:hypothetical protein